MPGKVNPPKLRACTYKRVRARLHMHKCVLIDVCVCGRRQSQSHQFSGVFPASPLLLITIDLAVIVYFLFLSFVCHQRHMVAVCINSYVVHICVCSLSSLISAQSQQKGMFRMLLRVIPCLPSGYRGLAIAVIALLNAAQHNHQRCVPKHTHTHTNHLCT